MFCTRWSLFDSDSRLSDYGCVCKYLHTGCASGYNSLKSITHLLCSCHLPPSFVFSLLSQSGSSSPSIMDFVSTGTFSLQRWLLFVLWSWQRWELSIFLGGSEHPVLEVKNISTFHKRVPHFNKAFCSLRATDGATTSSSTEHLIRAASKKQKSPVGTALFSLFLQSNALQGSQHS